MTAAWHPDPTGRHDHRYHDGTTWTANVSDQGVTSVDPLSDPSSEEPKPEQAPGMLRRGFANVAANRKTPKGKFAGITLEHGQIRSKQGGGPVAGAHATVETAGDIDRRITATRLLATGPLALVWRKKKDHRELYLTVEGPGYAIVVQVDPKEGLAARQFAALINGAAG